MKYQKKESVLSKVRELFINLDFFGQTPEFYYKGSYEYKSYFGATLTLGIIVVVIFLSFTLIQAALFANNVDFRSDIGFVRYPDPVQFNTDDYMLALTVDDPKHFFNRSAIGIRLIWTNQTRLNDGTIVRDRKSIPLYPCRPEQYADFPDEFNQYQLNKGLCPNETSLSVFGNFLETQFHYISIKVDPCNNQTHKVSSITCAPQNEIDNFFNSTPPKFQIYYKNTRVNPSQKTEQMMNKFIDNQFFYLDKNYLAIKADILLNDISIKSFTNFLDSSEYSFATGQQAELTIQNTLYLAQNQNELLSAVFRRGQNVLRYTRKYTNVGDVAARLGGIWGLVAGSLGLIARIYNKIGYQKNLGDTIFQYENIDHSNAKKLKKKKKTMVATEKKLHRSTSLNKKYKEFLNHAFNATYKAFKSPFHYIMAHLFCWKRSHLKMRLHQQKQGLYLAKHKLDVLFLLRKLQELEKLKYVLFDKNQRQLFEYIPPSYLPSATSEKQKKAQTIAEEKKITKSEVMDALKYYDPHNELQSFFKFKDTESILDLYNIYKVTQKGIVNQRLISLLGYKVLSLFRYLDYSITPEENKEIMRTKGVIRAFNYFKGIIEKIRERKKFESTGGRSLALNLQDEQFNQLVGSTPKTGEENWNNIAMDSDDMNVPRDTMVVSPTVYDPRIFASNMRLDVIGTESQRNFEEEESL